MHVDSVMTQQNALAEEGLDTGTGTKKAQDLHSIIDVIMASYVNLQNTGFVWDLMYKGKKYYDVEFVLFTPFLKLDGDEADKLCGSYTVRTSNVAQLCRYCECPTSESADPTAKHPLKTQEKIQQLVDDNDVAGLQSLSQQNIQNSFYKIRFGAHNNQGIHGACPSEMLHALLLGIFKYLRDCLFEQLGETSQLSDDFDSLALTYGWLMTRQSQRNLPKTQFGKGIRKGKLMAKEYPGVLLCMATVMRSTGGRKLVSRRGYLGETGGTRIVDWLLVCETVLQWEMWLKSPKLKRRLVKRARKKHRYIMYLIKKVARRTTGMGLKLTKFHTIVHMADDILNFGTPKEFDTDTSEEGHKPTKKAAKRTQKKASTFDKQTSVRLEEVQNLEYAQQEINGNKVWEYGVHTQNSEDTYTNPAETNANQFVSKLEGRSLRMEKNNNGIYEAYDYSRKKSKDTTRLEQSFIDFVGKLQEAVDKVCPNTMLRTVLKRNGTIFRADSMYRGNVWRDWVIIDWADDGRLPSKIWGYFELSDMEEDVSVTYGECQMENGQYAIVENANYVTMPEGSYGANSSLFEPISKEIGGTTHRQVSHLKFYVVSVEAFAKPVVVVPDLGGQPNDYFLIRDRAKWSKDFANWLDTDDPEEDIPLNESDDEEEEED